MNVDRALAAAVAVLCVVSFGTAATTLESSLSSEPGDLVDPDYGGLPFEEEDVAELRETFDAADDGGEESSRPAEEGQPEEQQEAGSDGDPESVESNEPDGPEESGGGEPDGRDESGGQGPAEQGPLDRLLAFLLSLWPLLVLLVAAALAYRYRDRIRALLAALVGGVGRPAGGRTGDPDPWADFDPSNDVERAWVTMVRTADLSKPWTKTPGECADEAVSAGLDPEGVRTITAVFEEVRYGGARPTDRHERRAREGLGRIDTGRGVV